MDLLSHAISTGRNEAPPSVVQMVPVTHEIPRLAEEVGVESAGGGAEEWIMDEDEGGFDDALLMRKHAWRTEFRSLSTLPGSGESMVSTLVPAMAAGQGLATVRPDLTDGTTCHNLTTLIPHPLLQLTLTLTNTLPIYPDRHNYIHRILCITPFLYKNYTLLKQPLTKIPPFPSPTHPIHPLPPHTHPPTLHLLKADRVMSSEDQKQAMIFGSELDALLASSEDSESPRDDSPRDESPRDDDNHVVEDRGLDVLLADNNDVDSSHESDESRAVGVMKASSDIDTTTKQPSQPEQQQPIGQLDTHPSIGMVGIEVDGGDVDMVVTSEDNGMNQSMNYPTSNSATVTTMPMIPQRSLDVNPFSSTQQTGGVGGSNKPGTMSYLQTVLPSFVIN